MTRDYSDWDRDAHVGGEPAMATKSATARRIAELKGRLIEVIAEHRREYGQALQNLEVAAGLTRKLEAREGELGAKTAIIEGLERKLAFRDRTVRYLRETIERLRTERRETRLFLQRLHHKVNPMRNAPPGEPAVDIRGSLGMDEVLLWGMYTGKTVGHVVAVDPSYVVWMENEHNRFKPSQEALKRAMDVISAERRRRARTERQPGGTVTGRWSTPRPHISERPRQIAELAEIRRRMRADLGAIAPRGTNGPRQIAFHPELNDDLPAF